MSARHRRPRPPRTLPVRALLLLLAAGLAAGCTGGRGSPPGATAQVSAAVVEERPGERYALLKAAVLRLKRQPATTASTGYGRQLSTLLGGKPFVIDTSRNGNGPYLEGDPARNRCNPPGRALGTPPTRSTGDPLVAAYLWIKRPGESDGECRGGPRAGERFDAYALELARNTR